jgi:hypothetical protein
VRLIQSGPPVAAFIRATSWSSTLVIWPCNALRRLGVLRWLLPLFACRCARPTRKKSLTLNLGLPPAHQEEWIVPKGLRAQGIRSVRVAHLRALRPLKIRESRVWCRRIQRSPHSLSGWVMSVPYPFCLKWLKSSWRVCLETANLLHLVAPTSLRNGTKRHPIGRLMLPTNVRSDPSSYFPDNL